MGFWGMISNIGSKVVSVGKTILDSGLIGKGIEWAKDLFSNIGSYDIDTSSMSDTENINKIINKYLNKIEPETKEMEDKCIELVMEYYDNLIFGIKQIPGNEIDINSKIKVLERKKRDIRSYMRGSLQEYISRRVSFSDKECLGILKGVSIDKQMQNFLEEVNRDALMELIKKLDKKLKDTTDYIEEFSTEIIETKDRESKERIRFIERTLEIGAEDEEAQERNCIDPLLLIEISEFVENEFRQGV